MIHSRDRLKALITLAVCLFAVRPDLWAVSAEDCSTCHVAISREWSASLHAESYTSPVFLKRKAELASSGQSSCACHAPDYLAPDQLGLEPVTRVDSLQLGVDCTACHLDKDRIAYSDAPERTVPHWVRRAPVYSRGAFCAGCHSWAQSAAASDCQDCHMPPAPGPATDGPHFERSDGAIHRSHFWGGSRDPVMLADAAELRLDRQGDSLRLSLSSRLTAHAFPVSKHHRAEIVVLPAAGGTPAWVETVQLGPDSTAVYSVRLTGAVAGGSVELRYYPGPAVWPDSFYVLRQKRID